MTTMFGRTLARGSGGGGSAEYRLLVRAGYIRRAASGGYTLLPLGKMVLDRVASRPVEMAAIGSQEMPFPALLPAEPYRISGRWAEYGDDIFRFADRRGADHLLGPDPRGDGHADRKGVATRTGTSR